MKIDLYTQTGDKNGQVAVNDNFFGIEKINQGLIHEALIIQLGNKRIAIADTKVRSDVRGGGRKPFRQKGTGHARQGTIRAPHYRGGGVVFGPHSNRNFKRTLPRKQRQKALFSCLSAKTKDSQVFALENFTSEKPKTKLFAEMVKKLPITRNALFVLPQKDVILQKSSNNIPNIKSILVNYLNIADLLKYEKIIFLKEALAKMDTVFSPKAK